MIFSLDFSKLKMVEISSFVLVSEIEDKIRELDGRNNFIRATQFSIFPNWSGFLVLVPAMSSCWEVELIEPEAWPGNSHRFLILPKVHWYQWSWHCENAAAPCVKKDPLLWKLDFRTDSSPHSVSVEGRPGLWGALPSFCRLQLKYISTSTKNMPDSQ